MVEQCCQATSDINIRDAADKTPLLWAAKDGNQEALEILIKNGTDTSAVDSEGFTILHFAINAQNESMVRWIIDNTPQALLNQIDFEGHSPLFHAQQSNNASIEMFLLKSGAIDVQRLQY